jgi:hypothetical protein
VRRLLGHLELTIRPSKFYPPHEASDLLVTVGIVCSVVGFVLGWWLG